MLEQCYDELHASRPVDLNGTTQGPPESEGRVMFRVYRIVAIGAVMLIASSALANVIAYEGMGPANTWASSGTNFKNLPSSSMTIAQKFTPTVSGTFEELYAAITPDMYTSDRSYTLRLRADAGNSPGTVLWQTTSMTWPVPVPDASDPPIFHLDNLNGPSLVAGQAYWLQADKPLTPEGVHAWWTNNQGYQSSLALSINGGAWMIYNNEPVKAMRVLVAIPEPASMSLLLGGLVMLLRRRRVA